MCDNPYPVFKDFGINNSSISFGKFSSERNFNLFLEKNMFFSNEFRSTCHDREDSRLCERWKIILENFVDADTCSEKFENLPDHDSCSFENRSSSADFSVSCDKFINANFHELEMDSKLFKFFDLGFDENNFHNTNLEIRNATNDLVAFFDNVGNLKLRGGYVESYASL